jgi:type I restriction enzyme S subunit
MSSKTKTTATKEEATPALVPKLRFPGFSKPWACDPLSKVLTEHKLKNTAGRDVFSVSMEYGIVNQIELLGRSYAAADTSHYTIGRRFDVVYTKSPLKAFPFGIVKQCKFAGEVALSPLYGVFTPPNPHVGLMIEAYFEAPNRSKDFLAPLCQKGAKNTLQITNTTFLSGRLPLPTQPPEQQKIAECLSSVDELIAAQARKLDALKTHKNGLMQQLFPREGESQPRLRFPEFKNAGEWVENSLGGVARMRNGYAFKSAEYVEDGPYQIITIANVQQGTLAIEKTKTIAALPSDIQQHQVLRLGDILISMTGNVGRICRVDAEGLLLNQRVGKLTPTAISDAFFYHLLQRDEFRNTMQLKAAGGAQGNLSGGDITEYGFTMPTDPAEQQRIADCLTSLDALITAETQKHEALKTHKRGLMQQLFPSPEEQNTL